MTRLPHEQAAPATMTRKPRQMRCVVAGQKPRKCAGAGCEHEARHNRLLCCTCKDRRWRAKHPEHHLWNNLKKSARKRGLEFTIRLEWWLRFCELTGFAEMVGREKGCASIDRIRSWEGYHEANIQILEVGANSAKGQMAPPINSDDRYYTPDENPLTS